VGRPKVFENGKYAAFTGDKKTEAQFVARLTGSQRYRSYGAKEEQASLYNRFVKTFGR